MSGKGIYTGPGSSGARDYVQNKKGSRSDFNLLSLAGGTYRLQTDEEWQELYRLLAADHQAGNPNFYVERKTPVFPLVFDIDFKHAQHDLQWLIEQILPALCRGLLNALVTECKKVSFMLSTAPTIPCDMGKGEQGLKSGAHVHFLYARTSDSKLLDVIVDENTAMGIRQECIKELVKQHGSSMDWETIVDPTVLKDNVSQLHPCFAICNSVGADAPHFSCCLYWTYQTHVQGLRLLFQFKASPCAPCKKLAHSLEKSAGPCPMGEQFYYRCKCPRCMSINSSMKRGSAEHGCSLGKVIVTRHYTPKGQYTYDLAKDRMRLNPAADYSTVEWDPLDMLLLTSVRLPSTDKRPPLRVKGTAMISSHLQAQLASHNRKRKKGEAKTIMLPTVQHGSSGTDIPSSDPRHTMVKDMLELPTVKCTYPTAVADLHRVIRISESAIKLFFVTGYCHNHKGAHASNRTYFFMTRNKITQYCYDQDCRGYKNVMHVSTPDDLFR